MATINNFINKIKSAAYGKDVRSALSDGLDAVNKEAEASTTRAKETASRQTILETKYNEQISKATDITEIKDAHVSGVTGKNYLTIGLRADETEEVLDFTSKNVEIATTSLTSIHLPSTIGIQTHRKWYLPDVEKIASYGFKVVRDEIPWSAIETEEGVFNFGVYDAFINSLIEYGIQPYITLGSRNPVYFDDYHINTQERLTLFTNYVIECVTRYANKGIMWEIWNEPNSNQNWSPQNPVAYATLVNTVAPIIKSIDPTAKVLAPALSRIDLKFLKTIFDAGVLDYIDAVSIHPYRVWTPESVPDDHMAVRSLIAQYTNRHIDVHVGECGYSTVENWNGVGNEAITNEDSQAKYLIRQYFISIANDIPVTNYYEWKDTGISTTNVEEKFGILRYDGATEKPAAKAIKVLGNLISDYNFAERIPLSSNPKDYLLRFNNNFKTLYVVWTPNINGRLINLPFNVENARIIDMYGVESDLDSNIVTLLDDSPVYILVDEYQPGTMASREFANYVASIAKNAAIKNVRDWATSLGLEKNPSRLDYVDLNNLVANGFYRLTNLTIHTPNDGNMWGGIFVFGTETANETCQLIISTVPEIDVPNEMYFRKCKVKNGITTWSEWDRVVTYREISTVKWQAATLTTGFDAFTTNSILQYYKDATGTLYTQGKTKGGYVGNRVFTYPVGSRPYQDIVEDIPIDDGNNSNATARIKISASTGAVTIMSTTNGSTDGICWNIRPFKAK